MLQRCTTTREAENLKTRATDDLQAVNRTHNSASKDRVIQGSKQYTEEQDNSQAEQDSQQYTEGQDDLQAEQDPQQCIEGQDDSPAEQQYSHHVEQDNSTVEGYERSESQATLTATVNPVNMSNMKDPQEENQELRLKVLRLKQTIQVLNMGTQVTHA